MIAAEWIDRLREAKGWPSDYRVAKELNFDASTISMYRVHKTPMNEAISEKVALALGERPEAVILDQLAERTKNPEARIVLFSMAQNLRSQILCKVPHATEFIALASQAVRHSRYFC